MTSCSIQISKLLLGVSGTASVSVLDSCQCLWFESSTSLLPLYSLLMLPTLQTLTVALVLAPLHFFPVPKPAMLNGSPLHGSLSLPEFRLRTALPACLYSSFSGGLRHESLGLAGVRIRCGLSINPPSCPDNGEFQEGYKLVGSKTLV